MLIPVLAWGKAGKKVLLVFSYHAEYSWVVEERKGVEAVFRGKGLAVEEFYLDTIRKTSPEWEEKVAEDAVEKIGDFKPDVVIVFDDNACELVAKKYIGKTLPFVFAGMNADPGDYGFPTDNITGVVEKHQVRESMELLKRLAPDVKKVAMIADDSPTTHKLMARIKKEALPLEVAESYLTYDFRAWKAKVKELQSQVGALGLSGYRTIKQKPGKLSLPAERVLQ